MSNHKKITQRGREWLFATIQDQEGYYNFIPFQMCVEEDVTFS